MAESKFKPKDLTEFRKVFKTFDHDSSGTIDKKEMRDVLTKLKMYDSLGKLEDLMKEMDVNKDGVISWEEFLQIMIEIKFAGRESSFAKVYNKQKQTVIKVGKGQTVHSFAVEEMFAFSEHINHCLKDDLECKKFGLIPINTVDEKKMGLCANVRDGILLAKFINIAVPNTIDERALNKPKKGKSLSLFQINENMNIVINSAKGIGIKVVNIGATELTDGVKHPHLVLGLIWQLVKLQLLNSINLKSHPELVRLLEEGEDLEDLLRLPPEQLLLRWFNYHLKNAESSKRVKNFSGDIKDSEAYTILLHQIAPGKCDNKGLDTKDTKKRAQMVLNNAKKLDVESFITAADICKGNPKLNLAFTAAIFNQCPGLDPMEEEELEKIGLLEDDVGDSREERAFRMWMNSLGLEDFYINNLFEDCADGINLLKVIDAVEPGIVYWKKVYMKPSNKFKMVANQNYAVVLGKKLKFSLVGIAGEDFVNKNKKLLLAFVWQLMRHHTLKYLAKVQEKHFGGKKVTDEMMVKWANGKVSSSGRKSRMRSLKHKGLSSGVFFLDLLYAIQPKVIDDQYVTEGKTEEDKLLNARYAISVSRKLGAVVFCIPEDLVEVRYKMVLTFVASIMSCSS
eukprot:CAMPEP_0167761510 /NCGR_PEP_ID=MMETSP0110_2-20121227/12216_1 /TAXON_ID=629695 /ORGANISM="Gymnochlora sp., Strain CCMP2014" /LENGTH=622 /DNA_ID=CAMNT_0007648209 /DNA_START=19 /DNA_END=1887 /DNA_ORIENTATION=+